MKLSQPYEGQSGKNHVPSQPDNVLLNKIPTTLT